MACVISSLVGKTFGIIILTQAGQGFCAMGKSLGLQDLSC